MEIVMKYMGSKARIAKHILPIMLKNRKEGQWWVEPFVGGANMIDKVDGNRLGADSNYWLIKAIECIRDFPIPKSSESFTESDYNAAAEYVKGNGKAPFSDHFVGYALFAFSFGAKWIGGWSRGKNSNGDSRDYVAEQFRANQKQKSLLQGVYLKCSSYIDLSIPKNSVVYCDIPYFGTTKYKDSFDHDRFWAWCRAKVKAGHQVFVSEYNAPYDFVCVWQKEIQSGLNVNSTKKGIEKLFVHKSQVESNYESLY